MRAFVVCAMCMPFMYLILWNIRWLFSLILPRADPEMLTGSCSLRMLEAIPCFYETLDRSHCSIRAGWSHVDCLHVLAHFKYVSLAVVAFQPMRAHHVLAALTLPLKRLRRGSYLCSNPVLGAFLHHGGLRTSECTKASQSPGFDVNL